MKKAWGLAPGLFARPRISPWISVQGPRASWLRFAQLVERAGHLALDRLGGVGRDLGRERPDLVRLACEHVELLADESRLELDDLGKVLGAGEALGEVEGGIQIALGKVDELAVEGGRALARRIEGPLERVDRLFERILAALISLAALVHGLLGESADALRHGGIELERLKFLGGLAEGLASGLGSGDLRGLGGGHDRHLGWASSVGASRLGPSGKGRAAKFAETLSCALQYNCCAAIKQGLLMAGPPFFHQE